RRPASLGDRGRQPAGERGHAVLDAQDLERRLLGRARGARAPPRGGPPGTGRRAPSHGRGHRPARGGRRGPRPVLGPGVRPGRAGCGHPGRAGSLRRRGGGRMTRRLVLAALVVATWVALWGELSWANLATGSLVAAATGLAFP